ncbi:MAG: hypothetical protein IMZ52_00020, partial [Actinobacteria bacterium]|nr:hypothetical protein [Actinomycetota bacterium]
MIYNEEEKDMIGGFLDTDGIITIKMAKKSTIPNLLIELFNNDIEIMKSFYKMIGFGRFHYRKQLTGKLICVLGFYGEEAHIFLYHFKDYVRIKGIYARKAFDVIDKLHQYYFDKYGYWASKHYSNNDIKKSIVKMYDEYKQSGYFSREPYLWDKQNKPITDAYLSGLLMGDGSFVICNDRNKFQNKICFYNFDGEDMGIFPEVISYLHLKSKVYKDKRQVFWGYIQMGSQSEVIDLAKRILPFSFGNKEKQLNLLISEIEDGYHRGNDTLE